MGPTRCGSGSDGTPRVFPATYLNANQATADANAGFMLGKVAGIGVDIDDLERLSYRSSSLVSSRAALCSTYSATTVVSTPGSNPPTIRP